MGMVTKEKMARISGMVFRNYFSQHTSVISTSHSHRHIQWQCLIMVAIRYVQLGLLQYPPYVLAVNRPAYHKIV